MTAEDGVYIPFPGTAIRHIKPISTTNIVEYYDVSISRCNKICPCGIWPQCSYYNKMKWKKSRGDDDEHLDEIRKWYETHFRIKFETPDTFPNG